LGIAHPHPPTLLIAAIFSRHTEALDWGLARIAQTWGQLLCVSERFEHNETAYYTRMMGAGLRKQLLAVEGDFDPAQLASLKLASNQWEVEYAQLHSFPEERPLNIDPGYLTPLKVVLASTKDRAHRIYLRDGIFAEECLVYHQRAWQGRPWTYPDYLRPDYHAFFATVRDRLQQRLKELALPAGENALAAGQTDLLHRPSSDPALPPSSAPAMKEKS
jgi:hypothetical protein